MSRRGENITIFTNPASGRGHADSVVRCSSCQRVEHVNLGVCLAVGWPKCWCNDRTMSLVTTDADVGYETGRLIRLSMGADR